MGLKGTYTVEDWTECAQTHTQTDRQKCMKTVYPPVSLRSLGGYENQNVKNVINVQRIKTLKTRIFQKDKIRPERLEQLCLETFAVGPTHPSVAAL